MKVSFYIPGEPKGKGRPQFSKVGKFVKARTPDDTVIYENLVKMEYQKQCGNAKFEDDDMLEMRIYAYYSIPKSVSKKKREQMLSGAIRPTKKPDMDNVVKVIADSLNNLCYHDDTQIVDAFVRKYYSDRPRVSVVIQDSLTNTSADPRRTSVYENMQEVVAIYGIDFLEEAIKEAKNERNRME